MWSQDKYRRALDFAALAHGEQKVPGKAYSYVVHLSNVCMEVLAAIAHNEALNGDLAVQCALLHDTIEDAAAGYEAIAVCFGKETADGVLALSKDKMLPKEAQLGDSLQRILKQPQEVGLVKLADRITNLQPPPPHWTKEKAYTYREEAKTILACLKHCDPVLARRLEDKIAEYKQYC